MELIPVLTLWLCMPLDATLPPVHAEELARFPAAHVARREYREAKRRRDFAAGQYRDVYKWGIEGVRRERLWFHISRQAERAEQAWSHLDDAHRDVYPAARLGDLRDRIGPANYYAGQMPAPVYVPDMPPRKAGDE